MASAAAAAAIAAADEVPRVLARNNACHQCRKRKLKCDAVRPTCSNCSKPRVRGAHAGEPPAPCSWDAAAPVGAANKPRQASDLESPPISVEGQGLQGNGFKSGKRARVDDVELAGTQDVNNPYFVEIRQGDADSAPNGSRASLNGPTTSYDSNTSHNSSPTGALVWSDWPMDLPSLSVVEHMCTVFFDKIPTLPRMIHRATFMSGLQLPPSNSRFPARPLLHAILAITANHISDSALSSRAYFPVGTPSHFMTHPERDLAETHSQSYGFGMFGNVPPNPSIMAARSLASNFGPRTTNTSALARFQLWHRRKAYESSPAYLDKGEQLVSIVQAHVIATVIDQYNAWWVDLWMESGTCMRMSIPLALHETVDIHPESLDLKNRKRFLEPATDPLEQAERDRTWWMVYLLDSSVAMTTVWPISMEEAEITVEMPVIQPIFDGGIGDLKGRQELNAPDLFSNHPSVHADSLNLLIKAFRLRNDVGRFFRQYSRGSHSVSKYASDPTLRTLLSRIHSFRLSCPNHLRRPTQMMNERGVRTMDVDLISAFMITHASSISLGEPLVNHESWTHDMARMSLAAVRAVLSLLYEISATSFDLTLFPPYITWVWAQSVRCLCRFAEAAGKSGDMVSVGVFKAEIEVFRMAMKQYGERYPVGARHLKVCDDIFYAVAFNPTGKLAVGYGCGMDTVVDEGNNPWSKPNAGSTMPSTISTPGCLSEASRIRTMSLTESSTGPSPNDRTTNNISDIGLFGPPDLCVPNMPSKLSPYGTAFKSPAQPVADTSATFVDPFVNDPFAPVSHMSQRQAMEANGNSTMWNSSTPFAAATLMQTQNMTFPDLFGDMGNGSGTGEMQGQGQQQPDQALDFGFDISSFSYDLDAVADLFSGSGVTFDGQDFVWKTDQC